MGKRKVTSILKRSGPARKKPKNTKKASTAGPVHVAQPEKRQKQPDQEPEHRLWHAASVVDRQAAHAVAALLRADKTGISGASIKSLTLGPAVAAKKATYAVTCETLRLLPVIRQAVEAAGLLPAHPLLPAATVYVLCYEALFGEGLRRKGPAERAVMAVLPALQAKVVELQEAAGVTSARQLVAGAADERAALQGRPRAARVNTLKMSVAEALSWLRRPRNAAHTHKVSAGNCAMSFCSMPRHRHRMHAFASSGRHTTWLAEVVMCQQLCWAGGDGGRAAAGRAAVPARH